MSFGRRLAPKKGQSGFLPPRGGSRRDTHARLMQRLEEKKNPPRIKAPPVTMKPTSTTSKPAPVTHDFRAEYLNEWVDGVIYLGDSVQAAQRQKIKITRPILWRDGSWVVVEGPFPERFVRGETRNTVAKAAKSAKYCLMARQETNKDGWFALCRREDIIEVLSGDNEFGPVSP